MIWQKDVEVEAARAYNETYARYADQGYESDECDELAEAASEAVYARFGSSEVEE